MATYTRIPTGEILGNITNFFDFLQKRKMNELQMQQMQDPLWKQHQVLNDPDVKNALAQLTPEQRNNVILQFTTNTSIPQPKDTTYQDIQTGIDLRNAGNTDVNNPFIRKAGLVQTMDVPTGTAPITSAVTNPLANTIMTGMGLNKIQAPVYTQQESVIPNPTINKPIKPRTAFEVIKEGNTSTGQDLFAAVSDMPDLAIQTGYGKKDENGNLVYSGKKSAFDIEQDRMTESFNQKQKFAEDKFKFQKDQADKNNQYREQAMKLANEGKDISYLAQLIGYHKNLIASGADDIEVSRAALEISKEFRDLKGTRQENRGLNQPKDKGNPVHHVVNFGFSGLFLHLPCACT